MNAGEKFNSNQGLLMLAKSENECEAMAATEELVKANMGLVKKIALEIGDNADEFSPNNFSGAISDAQFKRVKSEITGLVDRISLKVRKENVLLKERIGVLERENQKLYALLVDKNKIDVIKYFRLKDQRSLIN